MDLGRKLIFSAIATFTCLACGLQSASADEKFSDWLVGSMSNGTGLYAATINDSGLLLGEYCYFSSNNCVWVLGSDTVCEQDHRYPALANTDQGAASLEISCTGQFQQSGKTTFAYFFSDWKLLESLMKTSTRLGIAVPMKSDQFTVWRFSLDGMTAAIRKMEADFLASSRWNGQRPQGTFSTTL
jgi:hypothetical protein